MKLFNKIFSWLKSLFTSESKTSSECESKTALNESAVKEVPVIDPINVMIDTYMSKVNSYHKFKFPKGKGYRVNLTLNSASPTGETTLPTCGTVITLQHNNRKVAIGARRCYASQDDAAIVAAVWNSLLDASNTKWDISAQVNA